MKKTHMEFQIGDHDVGFEKVWVHMQDPYRATPVPYRIDVPLSLAQQLFDPYFTKAAAMDWATFIQAQVRDLGTFIFEGYIESMKALVGNNLENSWEWVLATVDEVRQSEDGIEIVGRALPFNPSLYAR
jgi:hypothetical protein